MRGSDRSMRRDIDDIALSNHFSISGSRSFTMPAAQQPLTGYGRKEMDDMVIFLINIVLLSEHIGFGLYSIKQLLRIFFSHTKVQISITGFEPAHQPASAWNGRITILIQRDGICFRRRKPRPANFSSKLSSRIPTWYSLSSDSGRSSYCSFCSSADGQRTR